MTKKIKEKSDKEVYEALVEYTNPHTCPNPPNWAKMCDILEEMPLKHLNPLVCNGWIMSGRLQKHFRFQEQLKWAYEHEQIMEIDKYLRSLSEEEWY